MAEGIVKFHLSLSSFQADTIPAAFGLAPDRSERLTVITVPPRFATGMRVRVRLFAVCRDRTGSDHLFVDVPGEAPTAASLLQAVHAAVPELQDVLPSVRVAVNLAFVEPDAPIRATDELALIPPVSGGAEGASPEAAPSVWAEVTESAVDPAAVQDRVRTGEKGGVVSFLGTVRNQTEGHPVVRLEYEAYPAMALAVLRQVGQEAVERWPGARVAVCHRTGVLQVGEISVAIAVAHPHRGPAFEACRHVIERLKQDVPIWKKEVREDGSIWVGVGS